MFIKGALYAMGGTAILLLAGCDASDGFSEAAESTQDPDPVIQDFPIVYIQRPLPRNDIEDDPDEGVKPHDVLDLTAFEPGAKLIFKERASASASETILTDVAFAPEGFDPATDTPPLYDVKGVSVSSDGTKLVFAMRAPEIPDADPEEQPTWNIWQYDITEEILSRVIADDAEAEAGQDIDPEFLPNGNIIFSSTRQRKSRATLLNEGKPQFTTVTEADNEQDTYLLHVYDFDSRDIEQISFNQSHDLQPTMLQNGRVMFLRWDNNFIFGDNDNDRADRLSLYSINPDGSDLTLEYGYHSQNTGTNDSEGVFHLPQALPDGKVLVNLRPRVSTSLGGDIISIDTTNFVDLNQPTASSQGVSATAHEALSTFTVISDASEVSPHGFFSSAFPLLDSTGRLLVSWTPCKIDGTKFGAYINTDGFLMNAKGELISPSGAPLDEGDPRIIPAPEEITALPCTDQTLALDNTVMSEPEYGLWTYDPVNDTQTPVVLAETGIMYTEAVVIKQREEPTFIPNLKTIAEFSTPDSDIQTREIAHLVEQDVGVLHIRSVYDFDGTDVIGIPALSDPMQTDPLLRPAQFIRFYKAFSFPNPDLFDLDIVLANGGVSSDDQSFKDILGYAPVHPDGSVKVNLPANVAIYFEILDIDGRRLIGDFTNNLGQTHRNWLTLRPGEVKNCNGCHTPLSEAPHGRLSAEPESANPGASGGAHFPNTLLMKNEDEVYEAPLSGQTMAEYYYAEKLKELFPSDDSVPTADGSELSPSIDLVFEDIWTDDNIPGLTKAPSFAYRYGAIRDTGPAPDELQTRAPVILDSCLTRWSSGCRITVNYLEHIQSLWNTPRTRNIDGIDADITCISCHSEQDADGNPMVPAPSERQLNLSEILAPEDENDPASEAGDFPYSYEYLFNRRRNLEQCDNGTLIFRQREATAADPIQFLREPLVIDGIEQFVQEQLIVDGELQFQALNDLNEIVPAPLGTDLTLVMEDGAPVPFQVTARFSEGDENILYFAETACELAARNPNDRDPTNIGQARLIQANPGDPIPLLVDRLDENGNRIPHTIALGATPALFSSAGARASETFFRVFETGGAHEGYLNGTELKLISEWLDGGGQFYNNPFETLDNN